MSKQKLLRLVTSTAIYSLLAILMAFVLFPLYYVAVMAFRPEGDILRQPIAYYPDLNNLTLANFNVVWNTMGLASFFRNSLLIAGSATLVVTMIAILVGYSLSRFQFRGKRSFLLALLATQFIPGALVLIPMYLLMQSFGIAGTRLSVVLAYISFQLPFNAVLMRGFVGNIPIELEESSLIDGCSRMQGIYRIVLPLLVPGIVAVGAFAFVGTWNEFLFAFMFLASGDRFTVPVGLNYMLGQYGTRYGSLAAGSLLALLPPVLLFFYLQKYLVTGISAGAVKG